MVIYSEFTRIYQLNMVIFHSCVNVYQRVPRFLASNNSCGTHPPSPAMHKGEFQTLALATAQISSSEQHYHDIAGSFIAEDHEVKQSSTPLWWFNGLLWRITMSNG